PGRTETLTPSLHDALPILNDQARLGARRPSRCTRTISANSWYIVRAPTALRYVASARETALRSSANAILRSPGSSSPLSLRVRPSHLVSGVVARAGAESHWRYNPSCPEHSLC